MRYGERLVDIQEKKGKQLQNIKPVYQLILYTGREIEGLNRYRHDIRKADEQENMSFKGDRVKTIILQIEKMKEEYEMERELGVMEQLNYLFYYNEVHRFSEMDEIVREVVKMHEEFIEGEDFIRAYEIERERSLIAAKMQRAKDEGMSQGISQGKHEEKIVNAKKLIQIFYNVEETQWIEKCKDEQLDKIYNIINQVDYEEFKKLMQE